MSEGPRLVVINAAQDGDLWVAWTDALEWPVFATGASEQEALAAVHAQLEVLLEARGIYLGQAYG